MAKHHRASAVWAKRLFSSRSSNVLSIDSGQVIAVAVGEEAKVSAAEVQRGVTCWRSRVMSTRNERGIVIQCANGEKDLSGSHPRRAAPAPVRSSAFVSAVQTCSRSRIPEIVRKGSILRRPRDQRAVHYRDNQLAQAGKKKKGYHELETRAMEV